MSCSCGSTRCNCEGRCLCCPSICRCLRCIQIRNILGAYCWTCGGHFPVIDPFLSDPIYANLRKGIYPNLDFLCGQQYGTDSSGATGEGSNDGMDATISQTSSTSSSESHSEDTLMFQMDDIDGPLDESTGMFPEDPSTIGNSDLTSKTSLSDTDQSKMPKMSAKMPEYVQTISQPGESGSSTMPPQQSPDETILKHTQSHDSEMPSKRNDPGCSQHAASENVPQPGDSKINEETSLTVSPPSDKFSSESLPSDSSLDFPRTDFSGSPQSPTRKLSTSAPSLYDLEPSCKLESPKQSIAQNTSVSSDLPKLETLCISDSLPIKTESVSSSSIEALPSDKSERVESEFPIGNSCKVSVTSTLLEHAPSRQETSSESSSSIETLSKEPSEDEANLE